MKSFSGEFLIRVQAGTCGMIPWLPVMEDSNAKFQADCHLANWLAYLDQNSYLTTAKFFRHQANTLDPRGLTLPDCDPWAYDGKYVPSHGEHNPWRSHPNEQWIERRVGKHATEQTAEERRETVESALVEVRKAARHMEMFPNEPRRKDHVEPPKPKTLDELKREAEENPVKMSPGLAARLGLKREDGEK